MPDLSPGPKKWIEEAREEAHKMSRVMQAFADGEAIESRVRQASCGKRRWLPIEIPRWNWVDVEYRVKLNAPRVCHSEFLNGDIADPSRIDVPVGSSPRTDGDFERILMVEVTQGVRDALAKAGIDIPEDEKSKS